MIKSKYIASIDVIDPDTGNVIGVEIRKLETGGMIGIDGSYLEQDVGPVYSPYDKNEEVEIPDNETSARPLNVDMIHVSIKD